MFTGSSYEDTVLSDPYLLNLTNGLNKDLGPLSQYSFYKNL